ncbi:MFS transporter [Thermovenabulum gondwanense]|uniref:Major facilitator superfamily (MFS) profile domain-containing protein n=1 Tax=Thermovenabulum gondwanense TaxID=520767 RepID=A0A162MWC0_9FIRM|nr:MFS transporter [Thermovenabulum gondwanense]KYO68005.1 hypothetical protein ATZ99_03150 [Thermovenabulum gondwanense]
MQNLQEQYNLKEKKVKNNFNALSYDSIFFNISTSFIDPGTIIPSFVSMLTSSPVLIGLTTTIRNCGWFLPQLLVARRAEGLPYKKPLVLIGAILYRFALLSIILSAFLAVKTPNLALILFFLFFTLMSFADGITGVPWIDLFAKSIPVPMRGRYYSKTQFLSGSLSFLTGFIIKGILNVKTIIFPYNYIIIFSLALLFALLSFFSFSRLIEDEKSKTNNAPSLAEYLKGIPLVFKSDKDFSRLILVNTLFRFFFLPLPFYITYARTNLGLPEDMVGIFVSFQMVGFIIAGLIFGRVNDIFGSKKVIKITGYLITLPPVLALLSNLLFLKHLPYIPLYIMTFMLIGATNSGIWVGIFNYLLKIAPEEKRPLYIGLINTLTAPTTFLPLLGGVIIENFSYIIMFLFAEIFLVCGLISSFSLRHIDGD